MNNHPHAKKIWDFLLSKIGNAYGVAALMGNLQSESGLYPDRLQGDIPYSSKSQEYTAKVDSGEISKNDFIYNGPGGGGYGLAQWTFWQRKKWLYEMYESGNYDSIGSLSLALDYLWWELQNSYPGVLSVLKTASNIRTPSDKVLHDFENPEIQDTSVEVLRASQGENIYKTFFGSEPGTEPGEPGNRTNKKLPFLLLAMAADE